MTIIKTKDFELIAKLNRTVHELHVQMHPEYFKPYDFFIMQGAFKQFMEDEKNSFLLLLEDKTPIGYAWYELKEEKESVFKFATKTLYIHQISIIEQKQGLGYGARLMRYLENEAKMQNISSIQLDYWIDNNSAKEFYARQGFRKTREFVMKDL